MKIFRGPLTRKLIFIVFGLALLSVSVLVGALFLVQIVNNTLIRVQKEADVAVLSARIRSECLDMTDLVRRYAVQPVNITELKQRVSERQAVLEQLIRQALSQIDLYNVDQTTQLANIRQNLTAFTTQASQVVMAFEAEQGYGAQPTQEMERLVNQYQDPLIGALAEFEQSQSIFALQERARAEQWIQAVIVAILGVGLLVLVGVYWLVRQVVVHVAAPLMVLQDGVHEIRRGRLDRTIQIKSRDEFGQLAEALNLLAREARQSQKEQADYARRLEGQVRERTQEAVQRAEQAAELSKVAQNRAAELGRLAAQAQAAAEVSSRLSEMLDPDELLQTGVALIRERFELDHVGLYLLDETQKVAWLRAVSEHESEKELAVGASVAVDPYSLLGWSILSAQQRSAADVSQSRPWWKHSLLPESGAEVVLPLISRGAVIGAIDLKSSKTDTFAPAEVTILQTMTGQFANVLTNSRLYQEVQQMAIVDSLTGVFNRRSLFNQAAREMERALRYQRSFSLILLDIDHFKQVNDTYGHPVGDLALRKLAQVCRENLRAADIIGRYGGEEFMVIMPETERPAALQAAERLRQQVEAMELAFDEIRFKMTISLGVATLDLTEDKDLAWMIKRADDALYAAKQAGRNRVMLEER